MEFLRCGQRLLVVSGLSRVDTWAKDNDCTRSEAIRRLVEKGLG